MGCGSSSVNQAGQHMNHVATKATFNIKVVKPDNEVVTLTTKSEFDVMPLPRLVNLICFDPKKIEEAKANFISIYNSEKDDFEYYVQKLLGIEIESETSPTKGKMWIPYIGGKKHDWDEIVHTDRTITHRDEIVWRFQKYDENLDKTEKMDSHTQFDRSEALDKNNPQENN